MGQHMNELYGNPTVFMWGTPKHIWVQTVENLFAFERTEEGYRKALMDFGPCKPLRPFNTSGDAFEEKANAKIRQMLSFGKVRT